MNSKHDKSLGTLSIIIPCLNSEDSVPGVLAESLSCRELLLKFGLFDEVAIRVVDDGSDDGSPEKVKQFPGVQLIYNLEGHGYGSAIKTGLSHSNSDWFAIYDMDSIYTPSDLVEMATEAQNNRISGVVGNRSFNSKDMTGLRRFGNIFNRELVELLFWQEVSDPCSGFWLAKSSVVKPMLAYMPDNHNFTLFLTLKYVKNKIAFSYVPVKYRDPEANSKLSMIGDSMLFLRTILGQRFS